MLGADGTDINILIVFVCTIPYLFKRTKICYFKKCFNAYLIQNTKSGTTLVNCKCSTCTIVNQVMLKKHGKIFCLLTLFMPRINFDIWCFISVVISLLTLKDLYQYGIIVIPTSNVNSGYKLSEAPILPEFDNYPEEIRKAIYEVYNITFKELAKTT